MKQFWFGLGLIGLLLISGFFLGNRMEQRHLLQAKDLERAADCVREEDWELAAALLARSQKSWEAGKGFTASFIHHDTVSNIDTRFAELAVYAEHHSDPEFRAGCVSLARVLESLPGSHRLHWWNFL